MTVDWLSSILCCIRSVEMAEVSWASVRFGGRRGVRMLLLIWIFTMGESLPW